MNRAASGLDTCDISPIKTNNKHHITPQRTKRKTSRRDQGIGCREIDCMTLVAVADCEDQGRSQYIKLAGEPIREE
ncbi:hypothetical protein AVEN_206122-1 [Araneus ventricosus]|uniref:Uncharacterized protein n=1 Tax=Araneus ventricosus TaxID=182803 RepID=A0A4Y2KVV5_ARAVE|nr:hypothetical protein AVEN_206122-1 [Araneus ventricosus]